jgi:hypothetical protein
MQPKSIFIVCFVAAILFLASRPAWGQATALTVPNLNWRVGAC